MDFIFDPSLVLYLPLCKLHGASFMSKDAYGHICTVTGALWRPKGRYFDGTDDVIKCGTLPQIDFETDDWTAMAWVKTATTANKDILCKAGGSWGTGGKQVLGVASDPVGVLVYSNYGGDTVSGTVAFNDDAWHLVVSTFVASTNLLTFLVDSEEDNHHTITVNADVPGHVIHIGRLSTINPWDGLMGEIWLYKRHLIPLEIQHNYLATKWRYR